MAAGGARSAGGGGEAKAEMKTEKLRFFRKDHPNQELYNTKCRRAWVFRNFT